MQVTMQHAERLTLAEMREFLDASSNLSFATLDLEVQLRPGRL